MACHCGHAIEEHSNDFSQKCEAKDKDGKQCYCISYEEADEEKD